ncbi:hypothetical protein EV196_10852 [Mariniflexile fucanivorans]|uniref:Uncharacterized protein n=1 Tax=Mariniflexile fucanivorans TaxID=264023 RepID=A0A4R1RDD8_9FLAO|nr:hypothetical protein EV196_10852 [Mariniflexile fucanivorans]
MIRNDVYLVFALGIAVEILFKLKSEKFVRTKIWQIATFFELAMTF